MDNIQNYYSINIPSSRTYRFYLHWKLLAIDLRSCWLQNVFKCLESVWRICYSIYLHFLLLTSVKLWPLKLEVSGLQLHGCGRVGGGGTGRGRGAREWNDAVEFACSFHPLQYIGPKFATEKRKQSPVPAASVTVRGPSVAVTWSCVIAGAICT
jgi:hypothetical protein